ncbi:MAG: hypothetical protein ABIL68_15230 [bacterium]
MRNSVHFVLLLFVASIPSFASRGSHIAKYANAFLEIGVGARPLGMGGAYVGAAGDVTAIYWNPAGLVGMETLQFHGMHAERFSGIVNWDFIGVGLPLKGGTAMGFGFFRSGVDGIPFTDVQDPSRALGEIYIEETGRRVQNDVFVTESVDESEMAFMFSFAKRGSSVFSYGGNLKIIRKSAGPYSAWGLGFDFGVLWKPYHSLLAGLTVLDGTSTWIAWRGGRREIVLPQIRAGLATPINISVFELLPVLDIHVGFENRGSAAQVSMGRTDIDFKGGLEIAYGKCVAIRLGMDGGRFTAGAGMTVSAIQFDYGFSRHSDLGNSHRISLTLFWDKSRFLRFWGS